MTQSILLLQFLRLNLKAEYPQSLAGSAFLRSAIWSTMA